MTAPTVTAGPAAELVNDLGRRLYGPRRLRRDLLAEVGDGLADATAARIAAGDPADAAERAAVDEFGPTEYLAAQYQSILARRQARRTAALGAIALPVVIHGWSASWPRVDQPGNGPEWSSPLSWITDASGLVLAAFCLGSLLLLNLRRVRPEPVARAIGTTMLSVIGLITVTATTMTLGNLDSVLALGRLGIGPALFVASVVMLTWLPMSALRARRAARLRI